MLGEKLETFLAPSDRGKEQEADAADVGEAAMQEAA